MSYINRNPTLMRHEEVVALTLYGECRGESSEGQQAVASVIYNRAVARLRLDVPKDLAYLVRYVCLQPAQFSCWNSDSYVGTLPMMYTSKGVKHPEYDMWLVLMRLACDMCLADFVPTVDANLYHTVAIRPYWVKSMTPVATIGNHIFYKGATV